MSDRARSEKRRGRKRLSKPARIRLPARTFTDPLARALIEQRQTLGARRTAGPRPGARTLDALTLAPEAFYAHQPTIYLALRTAYWTTANLRGGDDAARVQHILWDTPSGSNRAARSRAAEQLRRLQQMLSPGARARRTPGGDRRIARTLSPGAAGLSAGLAQDAPQGAPHWNGGRQIPTAKDLDAMLKAIQKMAQTGSRDAAARALAMLQSLIENLSVTAGEAAAAPGTRG